MVYEYIVRVGCEHAIWMELVDCLRFHNLVSLVGWLVVRMIGYSV